MNRLIPSLWKVCVCFLFGSNYPNDRIAQNEVNSLQLNSDGSTITSIKFWSYTYLDKAHENFALGSAILYVPTSSFAITDKAITGEAKAQKVYGIYGKNYQDLLKCNKEWTDMQELDITYCFYSILMVREYECTIGDTDGFQTLRSKLNKVSSISISRNDNSLVFSGVSFSKSGTEGCSEAKSTPIWLFIVIAVVIVCIILCVIFLIIKKRKSTPTLH